MTAAHLIETAVVFVALGGLTLMAVVALIGFIAAVWAAITHR